MYSPIFLASRAWVVENIGLASNISLTPQLPLAQFHISFLKDTFECVVPNLHRRTSIRSQNTYLTFRLGRFNPLFLFLREIRKMGSIKEVEVWKLP